MKIYLFKVKYATVINVLLFGPQDPVVVKEAIEKELRSKTGEKKKSLSCCL